MNPVQEKIIEDSETLAFQIKRLAHETGFDEVGITSVEKKGQGEKAIQDWVSEGRHGTMKYLEDFSERRRRFFSDFPDAKSVIVLGVNYYTSAFSSVIARRPKADVAIPSYKTGIASSPTAPRNDKEAALRGRIARYAWGKDYHQVIRQKHQIFLNHLTELLDFPLKAKSCVDIQPIPERYTAVRAGLGFIGKHTGLLSQRFGPWLFLSEIVTNLDLPEDIPSQGDCGTCAHCQKVCPTGALDQDYRIDARRCIAYLTIEYKRIIPRELRPKIKDWIFGCDECLAVCPFGSNAKESEWEELKPEAGQGQWLDLGVLFDLPSNSSYEKKYHGTALLRAGRKQMLRNACIVLGNSGREEAIPYLERALGSQFPLVRLHASWALGQLNYPQSAQILKQRLESESDPEVREEILFSLSQLTLDSSKNFVPKTDCYK